MSYLNLKSRRHLRPARILALTTAASAFAMLATMPSVAVAGQEQAADVEEIVITGSRIVRDGYEAPTPLTVVDSTALAQQTTTSNVADTLNTLPVFSGSVMPSNTTGGPSTGNAGLNALNLRSMGATRTLILLDGQRSVPTLTNGTVDVNNFPQQLIQRVDVVTGGASAVYGSDAVSGVVNFVLDRTYTGVKGEISGGLTDHGDDPNYKASIAAGFPFSGGRGHVLLSGEFTYKKGIIVGTNGRKWNLGGAGYMQNPNYTATNGQPEFLVRDDVSLANATLGGIIPSGPLKGTAFSYGGVPYQFTYGSLVRYPYMAGGDWRATLVREFTRSLDPYENRKNIFFRGSYDVTDNFNVFAQASWGASASNSRSFLAYQPGNGPTILTGNPFIPETVQARMTTLGLTSFQIGSMNLDMPIIGTASVRQTNRYVVGANGAVDAAGTNWTWDAYFQLGYTRNSFNSTGVFNKARYALAIDAVRNPQTGSVVCRSTLTNPTNGCVPWNPMGINVNSIEARNWLEGVGHVNQKPQQSVWAASVTGEPFSNWAGPVSLALSAEHRVEKANTKPDPQGALGNWWAGNYQTLNASYHVTEGAAETVVPLAMGTSFADS